MGLRTAGRMRVFTGGRRRARIQGALPALALLMGAWFEPGGPARAQAQPVLQMQVGYSQMSMAAFAASPDGALLAAGEPLGVIKIMEAQAGRLLCSLNPPEGVQPGGGLTRRFTWSADGRELLSPGPQGKLLVWDLARCGASRQVSVERMEGAPAQELAEAAERFYGLNSLPDDRVLMHSRLGLLVLKPFTNAVGGRKDKESSSVAAKRLPTPPAIDERLREGRLQVLGLSGNGRVAVLGEKCTPEFLVDLSNGTTRAVQLPGLTPPAGLDPNLRLGALAGCTIHALSPDAKLMAIKYRYEGKIAVVDALKGDVIASIALENPIDPTASSRMPAAIKTLSTDRESRTAGVTALSFSPDGRQLRVLRVIRWPLSEGLLELRSSVSLKLESSHALPPLGMGAQYVGAMLDLGPPGRPVLAMPRKSPQGYDLVAARGFGPGASGSGTAPAELWPLDAATTASSLALTEGELFIQRSRLKPYDMRRAADPKLSFAEGLAYSNAFSVAPYEWQIERWSFRSSSLDRQQTFSSALPATPGTLAYSADGKWAAALSSKMANLPTTPGQTVRARSESTVALIDLESSRTRWSKVFNQYADFNGPTAVAVSPDGSVVAVLTPTADRKNQLLLLNGQSGAVISQTDVESKGGASNTTLHFTQGGAGLLVAGFYEWTHYSLDKAGKLTRLRQVEPSGMSVWGVAPTSGRLIAPALPSENFDPQRSGTYYGIQMPSLRLPLPRVPGVASANAKETRVAVALTDRIVRLFDTRAAAPKLLGELKGFDSQIVQLAFTNSGDKLAIADANGVVWLVDTETLRNAARIYAFPSGSWAVVDADGRFDTNDIEGLQRLHWILPDEPFKALPLEIFMREYFTPGLLSKLWSGERLPPVKVLSTLNRAQPLVRIQGVQPSKTDPLRVDVTVEVEGAKDAAGRFGGVSGLQLFRDGSLVGRMDPGINEKSLRASVVFKDIRLPRGGASVSFSAYAFNTDRVKSETVNSVYLKPGGATAAAKTGKAYVIGIGVNTSDNPLFNLRFAANDARLSIESLSKRLRAQGQYTEVVPVALLADGAKDRNATKAKIRATLQVLAGKEPARAALSDVPEAARLAAATPDDLVIVTFAGHGYVDGSSAFYLLPQDFAAKGNGPLTPEVLSASAISTDDLEAWIREVDAGDFALVIDACHSAASVASAGFRPGPLGTRGLGQLAYDKGIRILAASQADDVAAEDPTLKHGLLTFALMQDGLASGRADFKPADKRISLEELLAYGEIGVPTLDEELKSGKRAGGDGLRAAKEIGLSAADRRVQRPRLFNFARRGEGPALGAAQ